MKIGTNLKVGFGPKVSKRRQVSIILVLT